MISSSATNFQSRLVGGVSSTGYKSSSSRLFSSSMDGPTMTNIDKEAMTEIIEDYEEGGRDDSGYVVMDVRGTLWVEEGMGNNIEYEIDEKDNRMYPVCLS